MNLIKVIDKLSNFWYYNHIKQTKENNMKKYSLAYLLVSTLALSACVNTQDIGAQVEQSTQRATENIISSTISNVSYGIQRQISNSIYSTFNK